MTHAYIGFSGGLGMHEKTRVPVCGPAEDMYAVGALQQGGLWTR